MRVLAMAHFLLLWGFVCPCPVGQYPADAPPHSCQACPAHTTTLGPPGTAASAHDCKCEPGYLCLYYKQVHATVTLNTTLTDFESDHGGVRTDFLSGVAAAAGVQSEQVHIHFVVIRLNHRRRRALLHSMRGCVQVGLLVSGASTDEAVMRLHQHLTRMHLSTDSWEVRRRVLVLAIPTGRI